MYWATGSARVLAVEPSLLKPSTDGEDEELELVLPVITSGQDHGTDIEANSQKAIMSRVVKGAGSGIVDMARNEQGSLWATITRESIQLWVHRVTYQLCIYPLKRAIVCQLIGHELTKKFFVEKYIPYSLWV
jgi:hypothetical protein